MLARIGPMPRLRLYTYIAQYLYVLFAVITFRYNNKGNLDRLRSAIKSFLGVSFVIPMPLARTGIYLAVKALIKPGQEVILSPYTIADVVNMVYAAGGIPRFADIDRKTCNISFEGVQKHINANTGAVLVTHFYGKACPINEIKSLCAQFDVPLIEDAAQAFGASVNGRYVGTIGDVGIFSYGMYKNVNAFYGGAVVTDNPDVAAKIQDEIAAWPVMSKVFYLKKVISAALVHVVTYPVLFRTVFFRIFRYAYLNKVDSINNKLKIDIDPQLKSELPAEYKVKMSGLQAALIIPQLKNVDKISETRISHAIQWHKGLSDINELIVPDLTIDKSNIYWYFPIQCKGRSELVSYAMEHGRDITESYHRNCSSVPAFQQFHGETPNAEATANSLIYLPTYPNYESREIEKTIRVIRSYFGV